MCTYVVHNHVSLEEPIGQHVLHYIDHRQCFVHGLLFHGACHDNDHVPFFSSGPISAPQQQQQPQPEGDGEATVDSQGLSEEDLAAFTADKFTLGAIPEHAPPATLCH